MKILQIIDSLGRGGAETLLVNVVTSLPQFEHHIICLDNRNEFQNKLGDFKNIHVEYLASSKVKYLPLNVIKLKKAIAKIQPDIIHSHLYWSNVISRIAAPGNIPFFFTIHSLQGSANFKKKWLVFIEKITYKRRHTIISVSKTVEDDYNEIIAIKGKHHVLSNMTTEEFFKQPKKYFPKAGLRFVTIGRFHPQKNQTYLLRSFKQLPDNIILDIYGQGPLEKELKLLHSKLSLKNVNFKGVSSKLSHIISGYDIFIMSSLYEGSSIAVLEAMASGLPMMLPDLPVFKEMAGNAAVYIDLNNDNCINELLQTLNSGFLTELSEKSFKRAQEVGSKKSYINRLLNIYGIQ